MLMDKNELKLFDELYEMAKPSDNDNLESLKEKVKIYDINPYLNYKIMKVILNKDKLDKDDPEKFFNFYKNYIQTLSFEQKKDIIQEIKKEKNQEIRDFISKKIPINDKSFIDCYFKLIQILSEIDSKLSESGNSTEKDNIIELFKKDYYVDNYDIDLPYIYGTNELIFLELIHSLYITLCFDNRKEKIIHDNGDAIKKFNEYLKNIIKKENNTQQNNEMNIEEEEDLTGITIGFYKKINFITPYLNKISTKDFKEIFDLDNIKQESLYEVKPKINSLIFHLLYFDLIFYIFTQYDIDEYIKKFDDNFFFEKKYVKLGFFNSLPKNEIVIEDENKKSIEKSEDIKNKKYTIYNKRNMKEYIMFNPYDYIVSNITSVKDYNDLLKRLENPSNFSLNKFFVENQLFNSEKLSDLFKDNIKNMLSSHTIEDLYYQYTSFNEYKYPYSGERKEKFIEQIFKITLYIPIPFKHIAGYTYKHFGIIFINNINRLYKGKNHSKKLEKNKELCQLINKTSFIKIIHIHEMVSHYSIVIIHSNYNSIPRGTPKKTFENYTSSEKYDYLFEIYDGGDKGEAILFGNKVKFIYTGVALFLLNNNSYVNDLDSFREEFLVKNQIKKGDSLDFKKESEISEIIKFLSEEKKVVGKISLNKNSISSFRVLSNNSEEEDSQEEEEEEKNEDDNNNEEEKKEKDNDEEIEEENDVDEEELEDEYYNNGLSCFNVSTHIFPCYKKTKYN